MKKQDPHEIIIYTTDDCPYCNIAENVVKEVLDEYKDLFRYKVIKVSKAKLSGIISVPTIVVGNNKIEGIPEKDQLHTALFS